MVSLYQALFTYITKQIQEQNILDKSAFNIKLSYRTYLGWYWMDSGDVQPSMGPSNVSETGRGLLLLLSGCSVPRKMYSKENRLVLVPADKIGNEFRNRAELYTQTTDLIYIQDLGYSEFQQCRLCAISKSILNEIEFDSYFNTNYTDKESSSSKEKEMEPSLFNIFDFNIMRDFVVIDMEKLNDGQLSVCEVGMVKYIDGICVDEYHSLIKPSSLSRNLFGKTKLQHITDESLNAAPSFPEIYEKMKSFIDGCILVCHNKRADLNYIYYNEKEYNLSGLYSFYLDTYEITGKGLENSYETIFNKPIKNYHHAIYDARHTAEVLLELMKQTDISSYIKQDYIPEKEKPKKDSSIFQTISIEGMELEDSLLAEYSFEGKVCVVSGESSYRHQIETKLAEIYGKKLPTRVTHSTNALIVSDSVGPSKKELAKTEKASRPDTFHVFSQEAVAKKLGII